MELSHLAAPATILGRLLSSDICCRRGCGTCSAPCQPCVPRPGKGTEEFGTLLRCPAQGYCCSEETLFAEPSTRLPCLVTGKASTLCSDTVTSPEGWDAGLRGPSCWLLAPGTAGLLHSSYLPCKNGTGRVKTPEEGSCFPPRGQGHRVGLSRAVLGSSLRHNAADTAQLQLQQGCRDALAPSQTSWSRQSPPAKEEVATPEQDYPSAPYIYCKVLWLRPLEDEAAWQPALQQRPGWS